MPSPTHDLHPIGFIRSELKDRADAPKQGREGAPNAWLDVLPDYAEGLRGMAVGDELVLITWFHRAARDVLVVHPRSDPANPLTGVFSTRSPDRPNPLGLNRVKVLTIAGARIQVGPIEAINGTPVVDIKPVIGNE